MDAPTRQMKPGEGSPQIPDLTLYKRIGRGGYGEVWLAVGVSKAWRAVKIFRCLEAYDGGRELRGLQDFDSLTSGHRGLLCVLHAGRTLDGTAYYYTMELADGIGATGDFDPEAYIPDTLRGRLVRGGPMAVLLCVDIGMAVADALAHLHQSGRVHRDIKPSNIVFVGGKPKLADIGLVAAVSRCESFVGTEGYVPREGPGSPRADIYALGKVLYEMATGKDRLDFPELPERIAEREDHPDFLILNEIVNRACAPAAEDRYATAADLWADLAALNERRMLPSRRRVRRRRVVSVMGALFVAGMLVAATAAWRVTVPGKAPFVPVPASGGWYTAGGTLGNTRYTDWPSRRRIERPRWSQKWTVPGEIAFIGDVDGDGKHEVVASAGARLSVVGAEGDAKWSKPLPVDTGRLNLLHDFDGYGAPEIVTSWTEEKTGYIGIFDGRGREVKVIAAPFEARGHFSFRVAAVAELQPGGGRQLICALQAGWGLTPRGVACISYAEGDLQWYVPMAQFIYDVAVEGLIRADGACIVVGGYAPGNGAIAGDWNDGRAYVHALTGDGRELWSQAMGGTFQGLALSVADLKLANDRNVVTAVATEWEYLKRDAGRLAVLAPDGQPLADRQYGFSMAKRRLVIGDVLGERSRKQIACGANDGKVRVLSPELDLLREADIGDEPSAQAAGDLTGDGQSEIVVTTRDGRLLLLDSDLTVLCESQFAPRHDVLPQVAIGDVTGDGTSDVVLSNGRVTLFELLEADAEAGSDHGRLPP